ncbi:MAG: alpha/beta fold hydrolase [Gemmatimonadota bacterium]|jgi:dipeptidyl aminopeptidase/acylaminoacyl peptidase
MSHLRRAFSGATPVVPLGTLALCLVLATSLGAQNRPRQQVIMDSARARLLYVSDEWEDHPVTDYAEDMREKAHIDSVFEAVTRGVVDYRKVSYRSRIDGLEIPAYVFQPLEKRGPRGHAAMVWVHGGVHGNLSANYWPFIREAVERGYVIICPEYRGSTGYGEEHHRAIDYGGYEVDDAIQGYEWLTTNLPHVDPERVGIMGWSHGGYITVLAVSRAQHPFKAGAAIVPVTNLIFRLSFKGPYYQRGFSTQKRIQGLPFEKREIYKERSPYYQVDDLKTPLLVHVSTNDQDVNFEEDGMLVYKLRALHPDITETKIYVDPAPWGRSVGHAFSRRVDPETLERVDSPAQRDSWNRTWTFFEWHLRPYEDPNNPIPVRTGPGGE